MSVLERRSDIALLNCLDPIYGHSLLKLLNAESALRSSTSAGCVLLIPGSLVHLVPPGLAEVWTVSEPASRFDGWLSDLEDRIDAELGRFEHCSLWRAAPHPHPSTYTIGTFVQDSPPEKVGDPSVVFSLRDDRTWGRNSRVERRNLDQFRTELRRRIPGAECAAIGVGGASSLPPAFADLRSVNPDAALERRWLSVLKGADLAVGVHGSNMLLPSGLAAAVIELIPGSKYSNVFQATLLDGIDPLSALIRHRTLYGDDTLSDVSAKKVAAVASSVIAELGRFEILMKGAAAGQMPGGEVPSIPASSDVFPSEKDVRQVIAQRGVELEASKVVQRVRHVPGVGRALIDDFLIARRVQALGNLPAVLADERGAVFELETRAELETFVRHRGHFERESLALSATLLDEGMVALDVGANVGAYTTAFSRVVGHTGRVHSFEPAESTYRRLLRTLELNELTNVTPVMAGVSDSSGSAQLFSYGPGFESWKTLAPRMIELGDRTIVAAESAPIQTLTLDEYCCDHGIGTVGLLKIDVEGGELRVLRGASALLGDRRIQAIMVEVSDNTLEAFDDSSTRLIELLEGHGLRTYVLEGGRLRPFRIAGKFRGLANVIALPHRTDA